MSSGYELVLKGNIDSDQLSKLEEYFDDDTTISKMQVKSGGIEEVIHLIFYDFNTLTFTRDFILGAALTGIITKLKQAIDFIKTRNKVVNSISIEIQREYNGKPLMISCVSHPSTLDFILENLSTHITVEIIESIENEATIHISCDENKNIDITIL